jgi:predicted DNA-binding protein
MPNPTASAQVNIRLPLELAQQLWNEAKRKEWTPTQYARKAIEEKLARDTKKGGKS